MIIRAFQLQRWDLFRKLGTVYVVKKITDTRIIYSGWFEEYGTYSGMDSSMGRRSLERVEYLGVKPRTKVTRPLKVYDEI